MQVFLWVDFYFSGLCPHSKPQAGTHYFSLAFYRKLQPALTHFNPFSDVFGSAAILKARNAVIH
jgi:hypothetical protein